MLDPETEAGRSAQAVRLRRPEPSARLDSRVFTIIAVTISILQNAYGQIDRLLKYHVALSRAENKGAPGMRKAL